MINNPTTQTTNEMSERKEGQMARGLKVRTQVKAGGLQFNHSETQGLGCAAR